MRQTSTTKFMTLSPFSCLFPFHSNSGFLMKRTELKLFFIEWKVCYWNDYGFFLLLYFENLVNITCTCVSSVLLMIIHVCDRCVYDAESVKELFLFLSFSSRHGMNFYDICYARTRARWIAVTKFARNKMLMSIKSNSSVAREYRWQMKCFKIPWKARK